MGIDPRKSGDETGKKSQSRVHQLASHSKRGIVLQYRMGFRAMPEKEEAGFFMKQLCQAWIEDCWAQGSTHTQRESP